MIAAINLTTNSLMFGGITPGEVPVGANRHIGSAMAWSGLREIAEVGHALAVGPIG